VGKKKNEGTEYSILLLVYMMMKKRLLASYYYNKKIIVNTKFCTYCLLLLFSRDHCEVLLLSYYVLVDCLSATHPTELPCFSSTTKKTAVIIYESKWQAVLRRS
jgi:hypothetical protein